MADYISDNPQFITKGSIRSGITGALDGHEPAEEARQLQRSLQIQSDSETDSLDETSASSTEEDY